MPRVVQNDISIEEPFNLEDLRWLVQQCDTMGFDGTSTIVVKEHKSYDQRDWDSAKITVKGKVK